MKISINKDSLHEKLQIASRFTLNRISSLQMLQGCLVNVKKDRLEIVTTNLKNYLTTTVSHNTKVEKEISKVVDIKKIIEFLSLLNSEIVDLDFKEKGLTLTSGKTRGVFSYISGDDFPDVPKFEGESYTFDKELVENDLPLVIFAAAQDESRPILTGINVLTKDSKLYLVATDGFRLSLVVRKKSINIPSVVISSDVLKEIIRIIEKKDELKLTVSKDGRLIMFDINNNQIYTRVIEGDFPPFEKVIPNSFETRIIANRDDLLRNIKMASILSNDLSHVIVFSISKDGLYLRPRIKQDDDSVVFQEIDFEGVEQTISFNSKFVIDFLNNVKSDRVILEVTQANLPGVFREEKREDFIHVIMPIRAENG